MTFFRYGKPPVLSIGTIFVDVDATLTDPRPDCIEPAVPVVEALVAERNHISVAEAIRMLDDAMRSAAPFAGRTWPFGVLEKFGVTREEIWTALRADYARRLFVHPDAGVFLRELRRRFPQIRVFTATTNARLIILAKLAIDGLADINGSPYLADCFGGDEVSPGGKCGPEFDAALLKHTGADPEHSLMIGDSPVADMAYARQAGIKHVVLPRRGQPQPWNVEEDGGIYVNSLAVVLEFINPVAVPAPG